MQVRVRRLGAALRTRRLCQWELQLDTGSGQQRDSKPCLRVALETGLRLAEACVGGTLVTHCTVSALPPPARKTEAHPSLTCSSPKVPRNLLRGFLHLVGSRMLPPTHCKRNEQSPRFAKANPQCNIEQNHRPWSCEESLSLLHGTPAFNVHIDNTMRERALLLRARHL